MSEHAKKIERVARAIGIYIETAFFTGVWVEPKLPWPAVPGEACPYCCGRGHDNGGPGPWWCNECNGTGIYGAHFGERPIILP